MKVDLLQGTGHAAPGAPLRLSLTQLVSQEEAEFSFLGSIS